MGKDEMLYGFSVYRAEDGERISAEELANENAFEKWTERVLPFSDKKYAVTEDGELLLIVDGDTIAHIPMEGKLVFQYAGMTTEEY